MNSNWSYSQETLNLGQNMRLFLSSLTLKFDGWPWKTKGHLFYTTSSFVLHFKAIREFKLELQSGNAQFGSKSEIFCPVWLSNLTDDLETNRTPFLCCLMLYASFGSNQWIQTGVTVRKCRISVKIGDFWSRVTLKFDRWHWKTIGQLFYAPSSCMHHFLGICEFKLEWWSGNVHNLLWPLWAWPLTSDLDL